MIVYIIVLNCLVQNVFKWALKINKLNVSNLAILYLSLIMYIYIYVRF